MKASTMMLLYGKSDKNRDHEQYHNRDKDYGCDYERERRRSDRDADDYRPRHKSRMDYRDDDDSDYTRSMPTNHKSFDGKAWVNDMRNDDGTTGAHWTREQTESVRKSRGIDCDPETFWIAVNMMYSDYHNVMQKFGVDRAEVYAELAKAFLCDKDSKQGMDKLRAYWEYVVE